MIVDELIEYALERVENKKVRDIRAGLGYTCVMLDDGNSGLAYTFRNMLGNCCGIINDAGSLIGRSGAELIGWLNSGDLLKSAMGLATIQRRYQHPG